MNKARVVQIGSPIEIYERPGDIFVTTFIGHSNLLNAKVERSTANSVMLGIGKGTSIVAPARKGLAPGQQVKLVIRPENVLLDDDGSSGLASLPAIIDAKVYQGALIRYQVNVAGQSIVAEVQKSGAATAARSGSEDHDLLASGDDRGSPDRLAVGPEIQFHNLQGNGYANWDRRRGHEH